MNTKKKILFLISAVLMMMLLCGCRTRITNNTEVLSTMVDETGYRSESYQQRREELGSPVAKEPLIKSSSKDGEEVDDEYYDEEIDYDAGEPEEWEDEEDFDDEDEDEDEDEDSPQTTTTTTTSRRPTTTTTTTPSRTTTTTTTTTTTVRVTLDATGGSALRSFLLVRKGYTYVGLPTTATRSGYNFLGWYTKKSGGKKVTSSSKVKTSKNHTLYAHWKKTKKDSKKTDPDKPKPVPAPTPEPEPEPEPEHVKTTVNLFGNCDEIGDSSIEIEDGVISGLKDPDKREKYKFAGWYTEPDGGSKVSNGDKIDVNNPNLYAHWDDDFENYWENEYDIAANDCSSDSAICVIYAGGTTGSKLSKLIKESKGKVKDKDDISSDDSVNIILIDDDDVEENIEKATADFEDKDYSIWLIDKDAPSSSGNTRLIYKMELLNTLHEGAFDTSRIDEAASELGVDNYSEIIPN